MVPRVPLHAAVAACMALSACSSMLPRSSADIPSSFDSYAQAEAAAGKVIPFETRVAQLGALGLDPSEARNVGVIAYPDIIARLVPYPGVPMGDLDPGIARCIVARTACSAFVFRFEHQERRREGAFWLDFLNVRRVTRVTGWWFETLIVVSDGLVLFRSSAGQPQTVRIERQTNPLGPFQPAGEAAAGRLLH